MKILLLNGLLALLAVCEFGDSLNVTLLHTNDLHSRVDEFYVDGRRCEHEQEDAGKCFGGFPRQVTIVKDIRSSHENVLNLNGGDFYQGTLWYTVHRWKIIAALVNALGIDVMSLGNHEFDDGLDFLFPLLRVLKPKVVVCNVNSSKVPELAEFVSPSTIVEVGGERIGIIGYITTETKNFANTGDLEFEDVVECIKREAHRLSTVEGLTRIIAVGHAGFETDQKIAREVPEIDIVVGAHSNTFLYNGPPPSIEVPVGPYPVVIERDDGSKALVVQAYAYGKYMGFLEVEFDEDGRVHRWSGNPILLDSSIREDPVALEVLVPFKEDLRVKARYPIGNTHVFLSGGRSNCQVGECNFGNLLADALLHEFIEKPTENGWNFIAVALWHTYGIRSSIDETKNGGNITYEELTVAVSTFHRSIDVVYMKGKHLRDVLEFSMKGYDLEGFTGSRRFLQVSGLRLKYNVSKPAGSRLVHADIRCADCRVPKFEPLDSEKLYWVAMNAYMSRGADGFNIKFEKALPRERTEIEDGDLIQNHLKNHSPIITGLEGRITIVSASDDQSISSIPLEPDAVTESPHDEATNTSLLFENIPTADNPAGHV